MMGIKINSFYNDFHGGQMFEAGVIDETVVYERLL
jgi:hypothetical protein